MTSPQADAVAEMLRQKVDAMLSDPVLVNAVEHELATACCALHSKALSAAILRLLAAQMPPNRASEELERIIRIGVTSNSSLSAIVSEAQRCLSAALAAAEQQRQRDVAQIAELERALKAQPGMRRRGE